MKRHQGQGSWSRCSHRQEDSLFFFDCPGAGDDWGAEVLGWSSSSFISAFSSVLLSSASGGSTLQSSGLLWNHMGGVFSIPKTANWEVIKSLPLHHLLLLVHITKHPTHKKTNAMTPNFQKTLPLQLDFNIQVPSLGSEPTCQSNRPLLTSGISSGWGAAGSGWSTSILTSIFTPWAGCFSGRVCALTSALLALGGLETCPSTLTVGCESWAEQETHGKLANYTNTIYTTGGKNEHFLANGRLVTWLLTLGTLHLP